MNKLKWIFPLIVICILLTGCPYVSDIPLDKPTSKINTALLGNWKGADSSDERYAVTRFDDYTYAIVKTGKNWNEAKNFRAYVCYLDGDNFINVWENSKTDISYYIYKIEINKTNNKITLAPVTENITEKFKNQEEMKTFFKKYKGLSFFYEKDVLTLSRE